VVVREASRRVGVSHNAAYRHFADRDLLLKEVCERSMTRLALLIEQRVAEVPHSPEPATLERLRLAATGAAYIEFALTEPGWFRTAFAVPPPCSTSAPEKAPVRADSTPSNCSARASTLSSTPARSPQGDVPAPKSPPGQPYTVSPPSSSTDRCGR